MRVVLRVRGSHGLLGARVPPDGEQVEHRRLPPGTLNHAATMYASKWNMVAFPQVTYFDHKHHSNPRPFATCFPSAAIFFIYSLLVRIH